MISTALMVQVSANVFFGKPLCKFPALPLQVADEGVLNGSAHGLILLLQAFRPAARLTTAFFDTQITDHYRKLRLLLADDFP